MPDFRQTICYRPEMEEHLRQVPVEGERIGPDPAQTLSICVCSIKSRKHFLDNLLRILRPQLTERVELLIEVDNGELTIGAKRQQLLERARGDYVACVDDDDEVAEDFVAEILAARRLCTLGCSPICTI